MRFSEFGLTAMAIVACDTASAFDDTLLRGYSEAVRGEGYFALPVGTVDRPVNRKRDTKAFEDRLFNEDFFYATQVSIGNPPQNVTVLVDTGSSELWVNPDCSTAKPGTNQQCQQFGQYNPKKSNTPPQGPLGSKTIQYGDPTDEQTQTFAKINYYRDTIALGGGGIKNQTFGIVSQSEGQSQGILGLAPSLQGDFGSNNPYTLVLSNMAEQGVINSRVFSLDLRHSDSDYGAVIYGGLDKSKFIGTLEKRPIINGLSGEPRLAAALSSVGLTTTQSRSFNVTGEDSAVLLDSGTTISRMHASVVQPLIDALGAESDQSGYYIVPCSLKTAGGSIDFGFGNKVLRVPMRDFVLSDSGNTCVLGVVATQDLQILGDSVLRAGYFVFDWDNKQVHIAQAANCGDNDIVAVSSGTDAVPSVTGKCSPSDAAFTGGPGPTKSHTGPSQAYTTVVTVSSCLFLDHFCQTGVQTRTVAPEPTAFKGPTSGSGGSGGGGGDDSAGAQTRALTCLLAVAAGLTIGVNLL